MDEEKPNLTIRGVGTGAWRQLPDLRTVLLFLYLPLIAGLGLLVLIGETTDTPQRTFFTDPSAAFDAPVYVGLMSNLGVALWTATAAVCLFAAAVISRTKPDRGTAWFLASAGLVSALAMIDDLFLFHEETFPNAVGIRQPLVLLAYGLGVVAFCWLFRHRIYETDYALLLLAGVFFAGSVLIDVLAPPGEIYLFGDFRARHLIEDGLKFIGIATWATYFWMTAFNAITPAPSVTRAGSPGA